MEIKTNSTRVIYNGETTTANAKYYIEYETDGKELKRVNASVNKVEEVEFPMEEGTPFCMPSSIGNSTSYGGRHAEGRAGNPVGQHLL